MSPEQVVELGNRIGHLLQADKASAKYLHGGIHFQFSWPGHSWGHWIPDTVVERSSLAELADLVIEEHLYRSVSI